MTGAMQWPREDVELVALRPEFPGDPNQDYDAQYNEANFRDYSGGHFRQISMEVRKQTFAEYIREKPPGVPHAFLALDCTYYLRKEVEELHEEDRARRELRGQGQYTLPRMSAKDSFIYASAVFPSLPGEYKLPWSSGSLVVENSRSLRTIPVEGWRPDRTAFYAALPLLLSLVPPTLDPYIQPHLGIVREARETFQKVPIWGLLIPVAAHTIPQCWGLVHSWVLTRLQEVHDQPRRDPAKILGCIIVALLTCWQEWSPIVSAVALVYLMRVQILQ